MFTCLNVVISLEHEVQVSVYGCNVSLPLCLYLQMHTFILPTLQFILCRPFYLKADRGNIFILYCTRSKWCMDFNLCIMSCCTDSNDSTVHRTSQICMLDATLFLPTPTVYNYSFLCSALHRHHGIAGNGRNVLIWLWQWHGRLLNCGENGCQLQV